MSTLLMEIGHKLSYFQVKFDSVEAKQTAKAALNDLVWKNWRLWAEDIEKVRSMQSHALHLSGINTNWTHQQLSEHLERVLNHSDFTVKFRVKYDGETCCTQ